MFRRFGVQLTRATRANHTERYQKVLDDYFKQTHFTLHEPTHIEKLKKLMPLVYLRDRPLFSLDFTAWEKNRSIITEIGFTIYDPHNPHYSTDLIFPTVRSHHFIIRENIKKENKKYSPCNKNKTFGGYSHKLRMDDAVLLVKQICEKYLVEKQAVLVSHDINHLGQWLSWLGYDVPEFVPVLDVMRMHDLSRTSGATLRTICRNVDVPHAYLGNAANDSYFSLLAAMKLCDPYTRVKLNLDIFSDKKEPIKSKETLKLIRITDTSFTSPLQNVDEIISRI